MGFNDSKGLALFKSYTYIIMFSVLLSKSFKISMLCSWKLKVAKFSPENILYG